MAKDDCLNTSTVFTQTITIIDDTAPVITGTITATTIEGCAASSAPAAVTTVTELEALTGGITITDDCTTSADLIVTSSETSTGTCPVIITRTYRITDACGNFVDIDHIINIDDNTLPVITGCPADISINSSTGSCDTSATWAIPVATDNCGILSFISSHNPGDAFSAGTTIVTYTATDNCGNISTCTFNVNVADAELPVVNCPADIVQVADNGVTTATVVIPDATISDNCSITKLIWIMSGATTATSLSSGINQIGTSTFNTGITTVEFTITDAADNSSSCSFTVTINPSLLPLSAILLITPVSCFETASGIVTVEGIGGLPPYEYQLNSGSYQSSGTFGSLIAGTYTFSVRDALLNTFDTVAVITQPSSSVVASLNTSTNILCYGDNTGSVIVTASGGTPPYEYKLGEGTYQSFGTFGSLAAGSYTITVQDANKCTDNVSAIITQPAFEFTGNITAQTNCSCFGSDNGSVTVVGSGGTVPYEYSLDGEPFQSSGSFSNLISGSHTITLRDANSCSIPVDVNITEPDALSLAHTKEDASCEDENDGSITLTITGGTRPYNALWGDGIRTIDRLNITSGIYSVIVTDASNCSTGLDIVVDYVGSEDCIEIPQIITPNNDGYNDTWKIKHIENFPEAEISVFTRWGKLVYQTKNISANEWDGIYKGRLLPTDSYHYVLDLNNGSEPKSGVISIIR